ncbi:MAG: acetylornithine deacetylase [Gammaproteobacteria bacterium]|nr:acetylornithine deacetylase [Gammaproteobacteria bacterium]MCP5201335.1 acetylornithine deacetylase [Gammaproteobacteria bacterium]
MELVRQRLGELVALPSVSCVDPAHDMANVAVVDRLAEWFGAAGFAIGRQPVSRAPDKANLIARLGSGEGGLVLSGHTDTVPYDAAGWDSDPFELSERDGRWYGLGSADMKCFFPVVLAALEGFDASRLRRPLTLLATADEESSMAGARCLVDEGVPLGDYALIGEPTALVPIHKHKGIVIGRIEIVGRSGHSSEPALGINALDCMHDVIADLRAWRAAAAERFPDGDFKVPGPTLNLGRIEGGDSPNRICARCELLFDIRLVPALAIADAVGEIGDIVRRRCAEAGATGQLVLPMAPMPALETPADSRLVGMLEALSGNPARTVAFATEGPFFNALGCESVVFGPGDIAVAHQPNEYVEVARVARMIDILRTLIERMCCDD